MSCIEVATTHVLDTKNVWKKVDKTKPSIQNAMFGGKLTLKIILVAKHDGGSFMSQGSSLQQLDWSWSEFSGRWIDLYRVQYFKKTS